MQKLRKKVTVSSMTCKPIKVAGAAPESIVDGRGIRYVLFVQGCPHHCPGCHNPQTHSMDGGSWQDPVRLLEQIKANPLLKGVTFSGGEPFVQADALLPLAQMIKEQTSLDLTIYSGWTYEQLLQQSNPAVQQLLDCADYLIDGKYIEAQRDLTLSFRGSRNQRIVDLNATREQGHVVLDHPEND